MGEGSKVIFSIFGILDVTGEVVTMWIILALVTIISLIVKNNLKEKENLFQNDSILFSFCIVPMTLKYYYFC